MKEKKNKSQRVRNTRRLRFGTASTVLTVVVIAAVILLNVLVSVVADNFPITLDLSANKIYTLGEESVEVAKNVKNEVEIVVFMDENEFDDPTAGDYYGLSELNTTLKEFHTALQQYKTHSGGKVTHQYINPDQQPTKFAAYSKYEVSTGSILFLCGERYKTCNVDDLYEQNYTDMYGSSYTFNSKVEKVLASNIHNLQSDNDRIVQVLVGHEEDANTIGGLKALYELNGYTFEEINIAGSAEFNKKAEVMLIPAPTKDYSAEEIKRVQQWVYNEGNYGHHLMVFLNPTVTLTNLNELLDVEYEIQVTDEIIRETDLNRIQQYSPYYPMCDVPQSDYTKNSVSTGKVYTPLARRLTTTLKTTQEEDVAIYDLGVLLTNYPDSAELIKLGDLDKKDAADAVHKADAYPITSMIASVTHSYNNNTNEATYGTVIVSGCSSMAYDTIIQSANYKNEELLLDAINTVTGYESSLTISNKSLVANTVTFSAGVQTGVGLGVFTIGIPVVLLIVCLVVFLRRKNL